MVRRQCGQKNVTHKVPHKYYLNKLLDSLDKGVVAPEQCLTVKKMLRRLSDHHESFNYVIDRLSRSVFELSELRKYGASHSAIYRAEKIIQIDIDKLLEVSKKFRSGEIKKDAEYLVKVLGEANKAHRFVPNYSQAPLCPINPYGKVRKKSSGKGRMLKWLLLLGGALSAGFLGIKLYKKIKKLQKSIPSVDDIASLPDEKIEKLVEKLIEALIKKKVLNPVGKNGSQSEAIAKILKELLKELPVEKIEAAVSGATRGLGYSKEEIRELIEKVRKLSDGVEKIKGYVDTANNVKKRIVTVKNRVSNNVVTKTAFKGASYAKDAVGSVVGGVGSGLGFMKDKVVGVVGSTKRFLGYGGGEEKKPQEA
jgi:hypothetical protein